MRVVNYETPPEAELRFSKSRARYIARLDYAAYDIVLCSDAVL